MRHHTLNDIDFKYISIGVLKYITYYHDYDGLTDYGTEKKIEILRNITAYFFDDFLCIETADDLGMLHMSMINKRNIVEMHNILVANPDRYDCDGWLKDPDLKYDGRGFIIED